MRKLFLKSMLLLCALIVGSSSLWGQTIEFNFEENDAHRTSGNNSYSSTPNVYSENDVSISLTYADAVTTGTPLNGSANIMGRVAKNTTNSPIVAIGGIDLSNKTITGITYYVMGVAAMTMSPQYSTDGSSWSNIESNFSMPTASTKKGSESLNIAGSSTFYLKFTVSVSSSTGSNRDFQMDDIVITYSNAGGGGGSTPTIALATYSLKKEASESDGSVNISYENITIEEASDFAIQYYNGLGEEVEEPNWIASEIGGSDGSYYITYEIGANTDIARSTYLKVFAMGEEDYVYSRLLTISQEGEKVVVSIQSPTGGTLVIKNGEDPISDGDHVAISATLSVEVNADVTHRFRNWQYKKGGGSWNTRTANFEYTVDANDVSFRANFDVTYPVNFIVNGTTYSTIRFIENESIAFPEEPADISGKMFVGWYTAAYENASEAPGFVNTSTAQMGTSELNYYAVFATGVSPTEKSSTFTIKRASAPSSPLVDNGASWTWSNLTFANSANACINKSNGSITILLPSGAKAKSLEITKTDNAWAAAAAVKLGYGATEIMSFTGSSLSYNFGTTYDNAPVYTMNNSTNKDAWVEKIVFTYTSYTYSNYATSVPVSKSISAAGWATYCSPYALDLENATGLTDAYIVTGGADGVLVKTSVKGGTVPANTGLLLKAPEGTVTIPVVANSDTDVSGNKLVGVTTATEIDANTGYVLMASPALGFYKNANDFTVGANTAYLPIDFDGGAGAPSLFRIVEEEDNATSIENVESAEKAQKFIENGRILILRDGITYDALGHIIR